MRVNSVTLCTHTYGMHLYANRDRATHGIATNFRVRTIILGPAITMNFKLIAGKNFKNLSPWTILGTNISQAWFLRLVMFGIYLLTANPFLLYFSKTLEFLLCLCAINSF